MIEFDFKRTSRKCSATGREFSGGEEYVSMLLDEGDELVRQDVAIDQFDEPPENCVGWWKSRIPNLEKGQVYWAPRDVLLSFFKHLTEQESATDAAYVMAILLTQKKQLRMLETIEEDGIQFMRLACNATKEKFDVEVAQISNERICAIQDELGEKLFTDIAPSED